MLTRRLWYSIVSRMRWRAPLPEYVFKTEVVRTFSVQFPLKYKKRGRTPKCLVELRCIIFSDYEQVDRAYYIALQNLDFMTKLLEQDYANAWLYIAKGRGLCTTYYECAQIPPPPELLPHLEENLSRLRKDEVARRVTLEFFYNWVRHISAFQSRWLRIRPPIIPDKWCIAIWWDQENLETVYYVNIVFEIIEPAPRLFGPYDFSEEDAQQIINELGLHFGVPDPPPNFDVYDTYVTWDFDCYDYDNINEARECMRRLTNLVSILRYAKICGDVREYHVYETSRGYHVVAYFNKPVPIYRLRRALYDDEDRLKMDLIRYVFTGIHDTLFTHKQWDTRESLKPPRQNEWLSKDNVYYDIG